VAAILALRELGYEAHPLGGRLPPAPAEGEGGAGGAGGAAPRGERKPRGPEAFFALGGDGSEGGRAGAGADGLLDKDFGFGTFPAGADGATRDALGLLAGRFGRAGAAEREYEAPWRAHGGAAPPAEAPPLPPPRTKWTRRVPHPVLIGHAASLTPY
jgi:hypothetical protein